MKPKRAGVYAIVIILVLLQHVAGWFMFTLKKSLRACPGVGRGPAEWDETYKIRVNAEKSINHFKDSFCIACRKTRNEKTLHADLLLAGITQLTTAILADEIHHGYIRSIKPLIA